MSQPPPPPYSEKPYPYPATYVPPSQPTTTVHRTRNRGFFGSLTNTLDSMGRTISNAFEDTANTVTRYADESWKAPVLDMFATQNIVQLISRSSGHSLQIVASRDGNITVDGLGGLGPNVYNAVWSVVNEGRNQVRLHNNNNYLAIVNGKTTLIHSPNTVPPGVESKLQLSLITNTNFIVLESANNRYHHVGILPSGQLKPASATSKEIHAHFSVTMIYSPYSRSA